MLQEVAVLCTMASWPMALLQHTWALQVLRASSVLCVGIVLLHATGGRHCHCRIKPLACRWASLCCCHCQCSTAAVVIGHCCCCIKPLACRCWCHHVIIVVNVDCSGTCHQHKVGADKCTEALHFMWLLFAQVCFRHGQMMIWDLSRSRLVAGHENEDHMG